MSVKCRTPLDWAGCHKLVSSPAPAMKIVIFGILFAAAVVSNFGSANAGESSDGGDGLFIGLSCEGKKYNVCPLIMSDLIKSESDTPTRSPTLLPGITYAPSKLRRSRKPKSARPVTAFPTRAPKKSRRPRTGRPTSKRPIAAPTKSKV